MRRITVFCLEHLCYLGQNAVILPLGFARGQDDGCMTLSCKISSPLRNSCAQEHSRDSSIYAVSIPHRTQARQFFSHASTPLCAYLGKPRTKSRYLSLSSFLFGLARPVLDCRVALQAQHPCGFTRLIHSSTHNEYYCYIPLLFHCHS